MTLAAARTAPADLDTPPGTAALIIGTDRAVIDRASRIAAAAGYSPDVRAPDEVAEWASAGVVLVDTGCAASTADLDLPRRDFVWLVSVGPVPSAAWRDCVALGGVDAVDADEHEHWLVDQLSDAAGQPGRGLVIAVTGACGGVGTSVTAAALALAAATADENVLIVDADPRGGHLDLLLEDIRPGLGWPDLQQLAGRVSGESLGSTLSTFAGIPVLTQSRETPPCEVPFEAFRAVLAAGAGAFDLTVVDVPSTGQGEEVLSVCDAVVVVTTSDARGGLAVRRWADRYPDAGTLVAARTPHRRCLPTDAFEELASEVRAGSDVVWLSEIKRYAERFARSHPGVCSSDRIVDDAALVLERLASATVSGVGR